MKTTKFRFLRSFTLLLGLLWCSALPSHATPIGLAVDNGNGTWTYSYTIDNTGGTFDIVAWSLEFNFTSALIDWNQSDTFSGGAVTVPDANWIAQPGIPTFGLSSQDFFSLDPASDVLTGTSLTGFSFISAIAPGSVSYYLEFGANNESQSGFTVGPQASLSASVPEGGSSFLYGLISLMGCCGAGRWLRRNGAMEAA